MRKHPLLPLLSIAALAGACSSGEHAPPNVLFVLIDTLRADRLGCYGNPDDLTPELDRLAEESVRFAECWSTTSWTLPSMATLLTANHGGQHRAWLAGSRLGEELDTLPQVLRDAGYRTAAFTGGGWVRAEFGLDRGFEVFESDLPDIEQGTRAVREYLARRGDEPWFVLLHTYQVHAPYTPPREAYRRVLEAHPGALRGRPPNPLAFQDLVRENGGVVPDDLARVLEALYDEEVRYTDRVLGRLLEDLRADGTLDRSVVVVTSDHGEEFGEHGILGHSDTLYAEQLHVPLLLRLPDGARAGSADPRRVSQLDVAPTILDAAGCGGAAGGTTFDGVSLLSGATPSPVYAARNHEEAGLLEALRHGDLVFIEGGYRWARGGGGRELYDLSSDRAQRDNLAGTDAGLEQSLERERDRLRARYGEPRVSRVPQVELDESVAEELNALGYL